MNIKEIKDFSGYYVTDTGKIYSSLQKGCRNKSDISKRVALREVKGRLTRHGYARVYLRRDSTGIREDLYVHRLVAEHFLPNPDNKPVVNHKNCIRNDNHIDNLEWVTVKENTDYSFNYGEMTRDKYGRYIRK